MKQIRPLCAVSGAQKAREGSALLCAWHGRCPAHPGHNDSTQFFSDYTAEGSHLTPGASALTADKKSTPTTRPVQLHFVSSQILVPQPL